MKKETKITQDKTQTRATIPRQFVDELNITKEDRIEWEIKNKKLKGELKR
jgi:antitoxin component of MazEF toxin-antitoxin module